MSRAWLLATLLAACASAPTPYDAPDDVAAGIYADHQHALDRFHALSREDDRERPTRCVERCEASARACSTADDLCYHDAGGTGCATARHGCEWTHTLLPPPCRRVCP